MIVRKQIEDLHAAIGARHPGRHQKHHGIRLSRHGHVMMMTHWNDAISRKQVGNRIDQGLERQGVARLFMIQYKHSKLQKG